MIISPTIIPTEPRPFPRILPHAVTRAYERFPRLRGFTRTHLCRYLQRKLSSATHYADSYIVGHEFRKFPLGDGTPLVLVVGCENHCDRIISVMDTKTADGCGANRDRRMP